MRSSLYVGISGQLSLSRQLDTIAGNVANASTAGYRAEHVKFDTLLSHPPTGDVAFSAKAGTYFSRAAGEIVKTDNSLDVALQGDAWFAIETNAGRAYTRDGRMRISPEGNLQTLSGNRILDVSGAGIQLAPGGGGVEIARDGAISQGGRQLSSLGLFSIDAKARLTRGENASVIPDRAATAVVDLSRIAVVQGYVERGNANPVVEMTRLIAVQRSFEAVSAAIAGTDTTFQEAIKVLGAG